MHIAKAILAGLFMPWACILALPPVAASAAEFKLRAAPYSGQLNVKVIELEGDIVTGDAERLAKLFDAIFKCDDPGVDCSPYSALVSLNSGGGNYEEGQKLAGFFREHAVASIVESGNSCVSACAIAFLGGSGYWPTGGIGTFVARFIEPGAKIGFHAPYLRSDDAEEIAKANLPLVLETARLDNGRLSQIINTYFVDPYVIGDILVKGPEETYNIETIDDMLRFRINFPYFPPAFVSGSLAEKVRNICLKLLSVRNAEPVSVFNGDYVDKKFGGESDNTRSGDKVFGYTIADRPLNIDFCGFTGYDENHPLTNDVQLFRLGHSDDGSQSFADPFYTFSNSADGWSTAGYDLQEARRSIVALEAPLNYWMYDDKARISDVAADFADYLKLQKTPPGVTLEDLQSTYLVRGGVKPSSLSGTKRDYNLKDVVAAEQVWPREMFSFLEKEAFAPSVGFIPTYSQKLADAFVVTGKDTIFDADVYVLGLRNENGSSLVRISASWTEGTKSASDQAHKTTAAIACSISFGATKLPCNH